MRTVAIVDDDDAVRDSLRFLLEVIGHPVATFASAAEFLKAEIHRLACLILDHHMPEMTGLELAERMRADGAGIPILLITGAPSPAIVTRAAEVARCVWGASASAAPHDALKSLDQPVDP